MGKEKISPKLAILLGGIQIASTVFALSERLGKKYAEARARGAFEALKEKLHTLTPQDVFMEGWKLGAQDLAEQRAARLRAEALANRAKKLLETVDKLQDAIVLCHDPEVPMAVKAPILMHWRKLYYRELGFALDDEFEPTWVRWMLANPNFREDLLALRDAATRCGDPEVQAIVKRLQGL